MFRDRVPRAWRKEEEAMRQITAVACLIGAALAWNDGAPGAAIGLCAGAAVLFAAGLRR